MSFKWIGAVLVIISCGGCGFSIAAAYKTEEKMYQTLIRTLQYMNCELQYKLTPLPELCGQAGREVNGTIGKIFLNLSRELQSQLSPDAASCMRKVLNGENDLPHTIRKILLETGSVLGRFDLTGQVQGLESMKVICENALEKLKSHRDERLRGYQTLGLCAGAALVIIFI